MVVGIQNVKAGVLSLSTVQVEEIHTELVKRNSMQSIYAMAFQTIFLKHFGNEGLSKLVAYKDWDTEKGVSRIRYTLLAGFKEEREALRSHIRMSLGAHPEATKLTFAIQADMYTWFIWFLKALKPITSIFSSRPP